MAHQSPSSLFFECTCTYDVFLSFKGTDTRFGFTGNLHKALSDKGINTFIDDKKLQSGDEITPSLVKAIEDSRIFIPVLSINYASSSYCLDELVHMIHCSKENGRLVLPVFYDVDPSHVRHQSGSYGKAIAKHKKKFTKNKKQYMQPINIILVLFLLALVLLYSHGSTITLFLLLLILLVFLLQNNKKGYTDDMNRLEKWKIALNQTANLSGHHFNPRNKYEHEIIEKIVKEVFNKIYRARLHVANYPVGLESRVLHMKSLMDVGCDRGVYMVGIYGTGGMGKSTLARATFNFIADQFECLCFLHNIRENSDQNGLKYLQEELLFKTVGLDIMLGDVSEGIPIIKKTLCQKKVLLVLDDIDKLEQLWALAGELDWFGQGSRVIITTRDKRLLSCHMIKRTCEVDGLNEEESFELLRWMAFKTENVDSRYANILNRAVTYASGLPLALEVVGSNLFGKCIEEWIDLLDEYEKIPNKDIHEILKVSFNNLKEIEQSVFLDIACCFKGYDLVKVQEILLAHYGCCKKYQIEVLVQKSLIKFSLFSTLTLHDLIEDMGKEIVRQESPEEPGKRSRLWFYEDIIHVLEQNTGTDRIGVIYLSFPSFEEEIVEWEGDELKNMKNLKTLIIKNGFFSKGLKHLPNSLRVLDWCKYPSADIPSNFCPKKLSICKLSEGCLTSFKLSRTLKGFLNMRELNLESCQSLTCINDVSGLPNVEKFIFQNCENLVTIHASVGFLNKLKILNAEGCSKLRTFPPLKLASLQVLRLQYCKNLKRFPEILQEMENIEAIVLEGTSIEELSFSFQNFTGLCTLRIWGNGMLTLPSSILMLPSLSWIMVEDCIFLPIKNDKLMSPKVSSKVQNLILQNCNISNAFLSIIIKWFADLKYLDLSRNDFTILPECLVECSFLSSIVLDGCKFLKEIRGIPPNLNILSALQCESLNSTTRSMLLNKKLHEARHTNICIPRGSEGIPKWFEHKSRGIERVPQWIENDNRGLTMSFWVRNWSPSITFFFSTKWMHNKGPIIKDLDVEFDLSVNGHACSGLKLWMHSTHVFQLNLNCGKPILDREQWIHVELEVKCTLTSRHLNDKVMKSISTEMGIHMLKEKSIVDDIKFTNPYRKRKLDEYLNNSQSQFHPMLKKAKIDMQQGMHITTANL